MDHRSAVFPSEVLPAPEIVTRARLSIVKSLPKRAYLASVPHKADQSAIAFDSSDYEVDNKFHLLLCASGSVATIKLPQIALNLARHPQVSIRIILTASAAQFLQGQSEEQSSLASIADFPNVDGIYQDADEWAMPWTRGAKILHIELRRWADLMVVAPLSANTLAKMVGGLCDGLLLSVMRAWDFTGELSPPRTVVNDRQSPASVTGGQRSILLAPAMNTAMWHHPLTQEHLAKIGSLFKSSDGSSEAIRILRPVEKILACGDSGSGAMVDWRVIVRQIEAHFRLNASADEQTTSMIQFSKGTNNVNHIPNSVTGHVATHNKGAVEVSVLERHLKEDICQGLSNSSRSARYYGFVTGGATPASCIADNIVTEYDQNVQVHLPEETVATDVEHYALNMLCELIDFDPEVWTHKTFTTGATSSNIMGLACGREYVIEKAAQRQGKQFSVSKHGLIAAHEIATVQVLTTSPHSSIMKAASIIGLGHDSVINCGDNHKPYKFDLERLTQALAKSGTASIIMLSCCEVNAGMFVTTNRDEILQIRELADSYGAWIHADAAMGFMARVLPEADQRFTQLRHHVDGLELCDSITGDGHKLLNVPYDTGVFMSRHLDLGMQVFQNPNAAYLSSANSAIPSPLHVGMENSRRFRALPVYANLVAYGREGYEDMIMRQTDLARRVAGFLIDSLAYDLYQPDPNMTRDEVIAGVFMIVMFRAKDSSLNERLVSKINVTRRIYVTGTRWDGKPAARIAVANWQCDPDGDFQVVKEVLRQVTSSNA